MIESAQSMLAGLFPPQKEHEIWEPTLNWQPIGNCLLMSYKSCVTIMTS